MTHWMRTIVRAAVKPDTLGAGGASPPGSPAGFGDAAPEEATGEGPSRSPAKLRALIVDDEKRLSRNVASYLERFGFTTDVVHTVADGRTLAGEHRYTLGVLDVRLPDGDGLDLLADLRGLAEPGQTKFVVVTGEDNTRNRQRAAQGMADGFLVKPFRLDELDEFLPTVRRRARRVAPWRSQVQPTVMFYSHDGVGLGHVRRSLNIARAFARTHPDANAVLLLGSPAADIFELPDGVDSIKLPSIVKTGTERWEPRQLRLTSERLATLRTQLIRDAIASVEPQILVIDHVPLGASRELVPVLEGLSRNPDAPRVVLGIRDILDDPDTIRARWDAMGIYDVIDRHYDRICVYGRREIYDSGAAYGLDRWQDRLRYCGYLGRSIDAVPPSNGTPIKVLIAAGGGFDAREMMHGAIEAVGLAGAELDLEATCIAGPLMPSAHFESLTAPAQANRVQLVRSVSDYPSALSQAHVVITMGGYNTLVEALRLAKPVLVVPRPGPSAEQSLRATVLEAQDAVRTVALEEATPQRLAGELARLIDAPPANRGEVLGADGASAVVEVLEELLGTADGASESTRRND